MTDRIHKKADHAPPRPTLEARVAKFLRARLLVDLARLELWALFAFAVAFLAISVADFAFELSDPASRALARLLPPLFLALQLVALGALRSGRLTALQAALELTREERRDDLLLSALTLSPAEAERLGYAPWLVAETRRRAEAAYAAVDLNERLPRRRLLPPALALAALLLLLPLARLNDGLAEALLRALRHASGGRFGPAPGALAVAPGSADVPYGQPLEIRVTGSAMPAMHFERLGPGGVPVERRRMRRDGAAFLHRVPAVTADFTYRVRTLRESSEPFAVRAVRHPYLTALRAAYEYPAYTGLPGIVDDAGRVVAGVRGTTVRLFARSSKPLASAAFVDGTAETAMRLPDPLEAEHLFRIERSAECRIDLLDREGFANLAPERIAIECRTDRTPEVEVLRPAPYLEWESGETVDLAYRAEDDFGIAAVRLRFAWDGRSAETMLHPGGRDLKRILGEGRLPVPRGLIERGGEIAWRIEATDWDDISGPKTGASPTCIVRIPSPLEKAGRFEEALATAEARLEAIADEERRLDDASRRLMKRIERAQVPSDEEKREAEFLVHRQRTILEEAREIEKMLEEEAGRIRDNPYVKSGLMERMNRLQELLREVASPELAELMRDMQEAVENQRLTAEDVKRFGRDLDPKKLAEKLDRTIRLLERMREEQALHALAERLADLARQERDLLAEIDKLRARDDLANRDGALAELARLQDELSAELLRELEKAEKLGGKIAERSPEAGEALAKAREAMEEALARQRDAAGSLRSGAGDQASAQADQANDGLTRAEREARDALSLLSKARHQEIDEELLEAARIARDVASGMRLAHTRLEGVRALAADSLPGLADRLARATATEITHMVTATGILVARLVELSRKSFQIPPGLAAAGDALGHAQRQFEAALMEKRYDEALAHGRQAHGDALRLAVTLLRLRDQAKAAGQQSLFQEYMEEMKKLAERQGNLNQQACEMGGEGMSEEMMKQMALEQAALRQGLEGMAERMGEAGAMQQRLRELASEMENLEAEYLKRNVDERIQERQRTLHQRMLETTKALKEEGEQKERKAERADPFAAAPPPAPPVTGESARARAALEKMGRERFPKEYEQVIRLYFERLGEAR